MSLLPVMAVLLSAPAAEAQPQEVSNLTVEITGVQNAAGQVCVSLFSGSAGFPNDETAIVEKQCVAAVQTHPLDSVDEVPDSSAEMAPDAALIEISDDMMEAIVAGLEDNATTSSSDDQLDAESSQRLGSSTTVESSEPTGDVAITQAVLALTFTDIEPGTYAVSVLHDENEDGTLNTGNFGIPTEGFGFSQNPEITLGAPEFREAAVIVIGREATTPVELIYY